MTAACKGCLRQGYAGRQWACEFVSRDHVKGQVINCHVAIAESLEPVGAKVARVGVVEVVLCRRNFIPSVEHERRRVSSLQDGPQGLIRLSIVRGDARKDRQTSGSVGQF